jgi:SAM-dependent methyltransferase
MMSVVDSGDKRASVWNEVAQLYGEGVSPFGFFSVELVKVAMLASGERVLDLGTGNGLGLLPAAQAVAPATVVGVDFASDMLETAKRRAASVGVSNIELARMDVAQLDFPDDTFDVALASSVFQFVSYSPDVLREWRRVLRPGGRLVFSVPEGGTDPAMTIIVDLVGQHAAELPADIAARLRAAQSAREKPLDLPALCLTAGFTEASGGQLALHTAVANVDEWWDMHWSHGIRTFLRELDDSTLGQIKREGAARLESLRSEDGTIPIALTMVVCHAVK